MKLSAQRNPKNAMGNGWRQRCPRCGKGHLYGGYLKVVPRCESCGLDLTPQRADDGPAYLTIVVVGHVLVPLLVPAYRGWGWEPVTMATVFSVLAVAMSLYLLPRIKGALIGFQWAKGLHGF